MARITREQKRRIREIQKRRLERYREATAISRAERREGLYQRNRSLLWDPADVLDPRHPLSINPSSGWYSITDEIFR